MSSQETQERLQNLALSGGKLYIWWKIVSAAMTVLVCSCVIAYFGFFYRSGWQKKEAKVEKIHCGEKSQVTNCTGSDQQNGGKNCETHSQINCTLQLEGFSQELSRDYNLSKTKPPIAGETTAVYYNPRNTSQASLEKGMPKKIIMGVLLVIALFSVLWAFFLFKIRNNKLAQGVAGVAGTIDLVKEL